MDSWWLLSKKSIDGYYDCQIAAADNDVAVGNWLFRHNDVIMHGSAV